MKLIIGFYSCKELLFIDMSEYLVCEDDFPVTDVSLDGWQ